MMARLVSGIVIVGGVTLVVLWLDFARHGPAPVVPAWLPLANHTHEGPAPDTTELQELALFQEIVAARIEMEAQILVEPVRGKLFSTTSAINTVTRGRRLAKLADEHTYTILDNMARAHGMTLEEMADIYRRGRNEGWPSARTPPVVP